VARNLINVDLFTDAYRVSCRADIGMRTLYDELGDHTSSYLDLQDAYISRINRPGEIVGSYTHCAFRKENINFAISQDLRRSIPKSTGMLAPRQKPVRIFLTVPSFEIEGTVMYEGVMMPVHLLTREMTKFLFIYKARASASLYSDISYNGDLILVDTSRIGVFGMEAVD